MQVYSVDLNNKSTEIDAGIKLVLAILLAVASSFCKNGLELAYFSTFLMVITVLLKSDLRFLLKNLLSFGIIILIPYLLGLLLSMLMSKLFPGLAYLNHINLDTALLKMIKIFFIWYIGNLYFFTTSFASITEMLNQVFGPLNRVGVPVAKYLHMIMFILNELSRSVSSFKSDILEPAGRTLKNKHLNVNNKMKELSHILVDFIANSLRRTDEIQEQVELSPVNDYQYSLRISKNEILAIFGCVIFLVLLFG